ncbi:Testis-specific Y-encoded protein 8, partial [Galemys pyrenaicus]
YRLCRSTPIQWQQAYEREAHSRRQHNSSPNFFNWFSDHSFAGAGRIAEIICEDLWPDPLQYYLRKKAPGERTERRRGEAPRPGGRGLTCGSVRVRACVCATHARAWPDPAPLAWQARSDPQAGARELSQ